MDEFALIDRVLAELGEQSTGPAVLLGPGDDCALLEPVAGQVLASSIDTLIAGVHFPEQASAELVGYRALAVSLSDLAAMGADPLYCLVAVTLPTGDAEWLQGLARGMAAAARAFRAPVVGGNLARGGFGVTVSVHGQLPPEQALRRSAARPGERILVSGTLGAATMALDHAELETIRDRAQLERCGEQDPLYPLRRYYLPQPRLELGHGLRGIAAAAIDVSDGLLADLGHICRASGRGAQLALESIPRAAGASLQQALRGGDDYELCLTVPRERTHSAFELARAVGVPLTDIGRVVAEPGITLLDHGEPLDEPECPAPSGYGHFR